jgi:hypothetical protein
MCLRPSISKSDLANLISYANTDVHMLESIHGRDMLEPS